MVTRNHVVLAIALLALPALRASMRPAPSPPTASGPVLEHGPPVLGQELQIELSGAEPGSVAVLFHATGGGAARLRGVEPPLVLEGLVALGRAEVDDGGRAEFRVPIPDDDALAELWLHLQALVIERSGVRPAAPSSIGALTGVLSLRLLADRVYLGLGAHADDDGNPVRPAIAVYSASNRELVFERPSVGVASPSTELGANPHGTRAFAFSANLARAVCVVGEKLLFFDNFSGATIAVLPLRAKHVSARLLERRAVGRAYVLGIDPYVVYEVDVEQAAIRRELALPVAVGQRWTADGRHAYLPGSDGEDMALVRVDLDALAVADVTPFSTAHGEVLADLAPVPAGALLLTHVNLPPSTLSGAVRLVSYDGPSPRVKTTGLSERLLDALPLPGHDAALVHARDWLFPGDELLHVPLRSTEPPEYVAKEPGTSQPYLTRWLASGGRVWLLDAGAAPPIDYSGALFVYDPAQRLLARTPLEVYYPGPRLMAGREGELVFGWAGLQRGELWFVDTATAERVVVPLSGPPRALEVLEVR